MALSRTQLSAPAGWMVEGINWESFLFFLSTLSPLHLEILSGNNSKWICFFIATTVFALPGLLLLKRANKI